MTTALPVLLFVLGAVLGFWFMRRRQSRPLLALLLVLGLGVAAPFVAQGDAFLWASVVSAMALSAISGLVSGALIGFLVRRHFGAA